MAEPIHSGTCWATDSHKWCLFIYSKGNGTGMNTPSERIVLDYVFIYSKGTLPDFRLKISSRMIEFTGERV